MTTTDRSPFSPAVDVQRQPGRPAILRVPPRPGIESAIQWLRAHHTPIRAELLASGALLIRGLPVTTVEDFGAIRDLLLARPALYKEKATPRTEFAPGIFSSTDLPAAQPIRLHNENSYALDFPGTLLFGCIVAAEEGGATTIGDMREALTLLPQALRERFERTGWLLTRNYSELAGLSWQKSFGTEDRAEVEQYCRRNLIGYAWLADGSLRTRQRRAAVITHPGTGDRVWFNHMAFWNRSTLDPDVRELLLDTYGEDGLPFDTRAGDGTALTTPEVAVINDVYDRVTVREAWQPGDVMLVDNIRCAHGRDAFQGSRSILVGMGDPVALTDCRPAPVPAAARPWQ